MEKYLYFKSNQFSSPAELASWLKQELKPLVSKLESPIDEDFMFTIPVEINGGKLHFYLGRNEEPSDPPIWQIWPEVQVGFFKKIFTKVDYTPEAKAKEILNKIISNNANITDVSWENI